MRPEESRVLVMAPVGLDAEAMAGMLRGEGMTAEACAGAGECLEAMERGAGAVLLTEEALELPGAEELLEGFRRQPTWSELPLIILTSGGESRFARLLEVAAEVAGGITLLERPMSAGTLLQTVRVALRSRQRQYQVRDLLAERERKEKDLRESQGRLQADVAALTRMQELSRRVLEAGGLEPLLQDVIDAAVTIMGADKGTMQLLEGNSLRIVAHHGHEQPFLEFFAAAENRASTCGEATRRGERVVVPDVELSPLFAGTPSLGVLREAGVRAVQSTPLMSRGGRLLGILTTQWARPYSPEADDLKRLDLLARQAADLIEHEQAQEALRESEEQFRTLADCIPSITWWANADGHITWYNRRSQEYTGKTNAEMEGWGWQSVHDPEMLPKVMERWQASLATGEPFEMEFRLRGAAGQFRWFLSRVIPVKDATGKVARWFGVNTDITEQKSFQAELERLVAERTAELRELVGELEHFSYSITHDMRAPLRAMMGFAEVAKELCSGCEQQELKMFLDRIRTGARRMDLLITDALNYSKAVRSELPLAPIDVGRLLSGMVHTYPELQVAEGGIRIEPELPLVMGNEAGLTQCFSNLLVNAVKFARPGEAPEIRVWGELVDGEKLMADRSAPTDQLSTLNPQRSEWVRIWVEDRGIGIKARMLPRVFDMFARGSNEQAGTGIGLALVRKVVQRMGGRVGVESEEGRGSRFWVALRSGDVRGRPGLRG